MVWYYIHKILHGYKIHAQAHQQAEQNILLTYSIYFSYAVFLTDYKTIFKIASGVKQLTVTLLPDPNCSMPVRHSCQMLYFFQNNVVPQFFNGMIC